MNFFALEGSGTTIDLKASAQSLDNWRVHKMHTETAQMLSAAGVIHGVWCARYRGNKLLETEAPCGFPKSVLRHPATLWVAANPHASIDYLDHLSYAWQERMGHGDSWRTLKDEALLGFMEAFSGRTDAGSPPPLCMPEEFRDPNDIPGSYQRYFTNKKRIRYIAGTEPRWFLRDRRLPYEVCRPDGKPWGTGRKYKEVEP